MTTDLKTAFPLNTQVRRKTGRATLGIVRGYCFSHTTTSADPDWLLIQWGAATKYSPTDPATLRITADCIPLSGK